MVNVLKHGTMKNYSTTEKYLDKFLDQKLKAKDICLKQLNYRFIIDFEQYLRNYKNSKKQTDVKQQWRHETFGTLQENDKPRQ